MTTETVLVSIAWLRGDQLRKLGKPYSDSPLNEKTDLMMLRAAGTAETAKKYGHEVSVITTTQAEAYANTRVREALEEAIAAVESCRTTGTIRHGTVSDCIEAIRALLPSTPARPESEQ